MDWMGFFFDICRWCVILLVAGFTLVVLSADSPRDRAQAARKEVLLGPVPARLVEVVDGDTLLVVARIWLGHQVKTRVRLAGVDAPEIRGRCVLERRMAKAARARVVVLLGGGEVTLRDVRFGKYAGRVVARVITSAGADLGAELVREGLGRVYGGGRRKGWCHAGG